MKKKKLLCMLLTAVLGVSLFVGCGGSSDSGQTTGGAAATDDEEEAADSEAADSESSDSEAAESEEAESETADAEAPAGGNTADGTSISVTDGSEDAMDINTATCGTLAGLSMCRHLYEGLYKLDQEGNIVLGQAQDVDISDDGLTYTFTLRDDINWSDGQPVTADDFIFGWQFLKDSADDYSSLLDMMDTVEAPDEATLVVTLKNPCGYLPSVLAFPSSYPVRQDIAEANGESYATDPDKALYNGPYELSDWTHQQSMTLKKRADYYDADNINVDNINWLLMSDSATMANAYKSGEVIYSDSYPEEEADSLEGLHFTSGYNTYCVMFNNETSDDALKDARVRKALSMAIDRERIMNIRNLNDELANTYTPSGLTNASGVEFNTTVDPWFSDSYEENCQTAKDLLAAAGFENGAGFPSLTYIVNNDDRKTIAEAVVSDWKDVLGIDSITVETDENFFATRNSGDYDLAYFGWYMDYVDISNMLYTMTTGQNDAKYSNELYDESYNAAVAEADEAAQWEYYKSCESVLMQDMPVAPILHAMNGYLFDDASYDGLVYYCGTTFFGFVQAK